jgi:hypothetical protein
MSQTHAQDRFDTDLSLPNYHPKSAKKRQGRKALAAVSDHLESICSIELRKYKSATQRVMKRLLQLAANKKAAPNDAAYETVPWPKFLLF